MSHNIFLGLPGIQQALTVWKALTYGLLSLCGEHEGAHNAVIALLKAGHTRFVMPACTKQLNELNSLYQIDLLSRQEIATAVQTQLASVKYTAKINE